MKKSIFVAPLVLVGLSFFASTVQAEEIEEDNSSFEVVEIKDIINEDLIFDQNPVEDLLSYNNMLRGTNKPGSEKKITGNTKYNYSGSYRGNGTLFTNYKFYGSKKYKVTVNNTGSNTVKVYAERDWKTYSSTSVSAGKSASFTFSDINSDTRFWVKITGRDFSVSGTVSAS